MCCYWVVPYSSDSFSFVYEIFLSLSLFPCLSFPHLLLPSFEDYFMSNELKFHDTGSWYGSIFSHWTGPLIIYFNMETHVHFLIYFTISFPPFFSVLLLEFLFVGSWNPWFDLLFHHSVLLFLLRNKRNLVIFKSSSCHKIPSCGLLFFFLEGNSFFCLSRDNNERRSPFFFFFSFAPYFLQVSFSFPAPTTPTAPHYFLILVSVFPTGNFLRLPDDACLIECSGCRGGGGWDQTAGKSRCRALRERLYFSLETLKYHYV